VPCQKDLAQFVEVWKINQDTSSHKSWFRGAKWVQKNESEKINHIENYL
jgi:hypothetical protein